MVSAVAPAMATRLRRIKATRTNQELIEELASFVGETRTGGGSTRLPPRVSKQTYRLSEIRNWPWPRDTISDNTTRPGSFRGWRPQPVSGRMGADHLGSSLLTGPARGKNPTQMHSSSSTEELSSKRSDPVVDSKIQEMLTLRAIQVLDRKAEVFISRVFTVPKIERGKEYGRRFILNLKVSIRSFSAIL